MNQAMRESVDGLVCLCARASRATADFYARIGQPAPARGPRFEAVKKGKAWHIVELATGKTRDFCFTPQAAARFVEAMEAASNRKLVGRA